jgi:F0F1-type ATP synthase assembly protein I
MFLDSSDRRELGKYLALAQVGFEMVGPIGIGILLDVYLGWSPWGIVGGAVVGLCGGLAHLITLTNRQDRVDSSEPKRGGP